MKLRAIAFLLLALALGGCSALGNQAAQPLPTVVLDSKTVSPQPVATSFVKIGGLSASGTVVPIAEIHLAFKQQAKVKTVNVAVGDRVKAGQVLAQLDDSVLQAQIAQAKAAIKVAQANYDLLAVKPASEQVRQSEAALLAATANLSRTIAPSRPADIASAQAALDAAVQAYNKLKAGPLKEDLASAEAGYRNAEAALKQAQYGYDNANRQNPAAIGASPAALALEQATNNYVQAKSLYDKAAQAPDNAQVSAAYQAVAAARAALDRVQNPAGEYDIAQARAQVETAQAQLDALKAGARSLQLDVAQAQVDATRAALQVLEAQSPDYSLVAPSDAMVIQRAIQPGESILPGTQVITLADVDHLRVETKDLSERDVPGIAIGQAANVTIKALNQNVTGHVSAIAPTADTLGGDVVYRTTIELDSLPPGLRAGMSVEVEFAAARQ